eukprot:m.133766 g.133766  ORF g.133766 m.133766 type:complete len:124 (-) comp15808_c1_seq1:72-443(-)
MKVYHPQKDFLSLLALGDDTALGSKWGISMKGRWVWRLKDHIDRTWMTKFKKLLPKTPNHVADESSRNDGEMTANPEQQPTIDRVSNNNNIHKRPVACRALLTVFVLAAAFFISSVWSRPSAS